MTIGERIKNARIEKSLTQKQLGDLSGMADSAIRRYESNRGNPTYSTLERIASAMKISVHDLTGEYDEADLIQRETYASYSIDEAALSLGYKICNKNDHYWIEDVKSGKKYNTSQIAIDQLENSVISYLKFQIQNLIQNEESPQSE